MSSRQHTWFLDNVCHQVISQVTEKRVISLNRNIGSLSPLRRYLLEGSQEAPQEPILDLPSMFTFISWERKDSLG